jgi:hypothetical protein
MGLAPSCRPLLGAKRHIGKAGWQAAGGVESALMQGEQVMGRGRKEGENAPHARWPAGRLGVHSVLRGVPAPAKRLHA